MPRLEEYANRIDYGSREYGRRPTLGAVLRRRSQSAIEASESTLDEDALLKFFRMQRPRLTSTAEFVAWKKRLADLRKRLGDYLEDLNEWKHPAASNYARKLMEAYGAPSECNERMCLWESIDPFSEVYILDESIPHDVPKLHMDYLYSTMKIPVPLMKVHLLAKASKSIIVDRLKDTVTARCGALIKNAVTLGFVQEILSGRIKSPEIEPEYSRRILGNITPKWYRDILGERRRT